MADSAAECSPRCAVLQLLLPSAQHKAGEELRQKRERKHGFLRSYASLKMADQSWRNGPTWQMSTNSHDPDPVWLQPSTRCLPSLNRSRSLITLLQWGRNHPPHQAGLIPRRGEHPQLWLNSAGRASGPRHPA